MKIAVAGTGYVGLSNALLLSQHNDVWASLLIPGNVPRVLSTEAILAEWS